MRTRIPNRIAKYVLVALIAFSCLLPLAWMAIAGFKGKTEVLRTPFQFFPDVWILDNYIAILGDQAFVRALGVTFVGAVAFTALSLAINALAAYVFARLDFAGKRFFWIYCLAPMFIPGMAILLTSFVVVSQLGMIDTLWVLIIPGAASSLQMFFIRQFYLNIPVAMEEAALLDGANRWQIFLRIFLPQSQAPFVIVGVASYLVYWNAYVWPVLTISANQDLYQIMQLLRSFMSERSTEWGLLMAGSTIAALPTIILVLVFQRYIVNGIRIAGMK
jgi:multiple sugar transport system permease protein